MKKQLAIIYGGKSTEHEISIRSARNVFKNTDTDIFDVHLIYINKKGGWFVSDSEKLEQAITAFQMEEMLSIVTEENTFYFRSKKGDIKPDVIFPVLHGPNGEDGSIQGLFEVASIPYVGPGIGGSANAMDKEVAKRIFIEAGLHVANYVSLASWQEEIDLRPAVEKLGFPMVVKPCSAGSSVGVSKVETEEELIEAIEKAFEYDHKILLEEYVVGREIEVAVLGNENPIPSPPGEIVTAFYDYKEKYAQESKTRLDAPADLTKKQIDELQDLAVHAYMALGCEGMSRVDFFLTEDSYVINEINTIPGFTNISMYPKLFEVKGIPQKELITHLINYALERKKRKDELKTFFEA
jgi:D-alanine-D-alanine ligase